MRQPMRVAAVLAILVAALTPLLSCGRSRSEAAGQAEQERSRYSESPILRGRVERGELPPVEERLPKEPLVVKPIDGPGRYDSEPPGE